MNNIKLDYQKLPEFDYDDLPITLTKLEPMAVGMGLSFLTIGDPHFKTDNLHELPLYISRILHVIRKETPTHVVILGDMLHCHERLHTSVLNKAYKFINDIRLLCPVYVIVGNHDYINNSQFLSTEHWMNAMKEWSNVFIVDQGIVKETNFGKFIFCPYLPPGRFKEALNIIDKDWKTARAIFCHQEFFGCKMGAIQSVEGDVWERNDPLVISGHVHDKQRVQDNIFYTGSSIQHAFGETGKKTITMCYFEKVVRLESINLDLPQKKILYMSIHDIQDFKHNNTRDKLRITLKGTREEFNVFRKSKKYKELTSQDIKIVFQPLIVDKPLSRVSSLENFTTILEELVLHEKNELLTQMYKEMV